MAPELLWRHHAHPRTQAPATVRAGAAGHPPSGDDISEPLWSGHPCPAASISLCGGPAATLPLGYHHLGDFYNLGGTFCSEQDLCARVPHSLCHPRLAPLASGDLVPCVGHTKPPLETSPLGLGARPVTPLPGGHRWPRGQDCSGAGRLPTRPHDHHGHAGCHGYARVDRGAPGVRATQE